MTYKIRLKEGSVRVGVLQHLFIYLALTWETKIGGGALLMKFWTPSQEISKVYNFAPSHPPPPSQFIVLSEGANVQNVLGHTNSDIIKMYL